MKYKYYYTIMMKTYGLPDYFNKDLSEEEDCFIFDTERESNECLKLIFNNWKNIISELDNGNSLYLVNVDGVERMYAESYLELITKAASNEDNDVSLKESLQDVYKAIVDELSLTNNKEDDIKNALKLSRYLAILSAQFCRR